MKNPLQVSGISPLVRGFIQQKVNADPALHSHLLSNFLSEVLFLLLDALAGLETNEAFNGDLRVVRLCHLLYVLAYRLLSVLSLYISLSALS